jgi:tetratricopeptide (TPR) repeat protein
MPRYARDVASQVSSLTEGRNRRIVAIVASCALAAAALVVGLTRYEMRGQRTTVPGAVTSPRAGTPPLQLEFGLRPSAEATALARAEKLLDNARNPQPAQAAAIFRRYHSLAAQLGLLFATWQGPSSLPAVKRLAAAHSDEPAALLNLGWADYQDGRNADAVAAWQKVAREVPDSPYGVDAEDALHSGEIPGLPYLVLDFQPPRSITGLPPAQELAAAARAAAKPDAQAKLVYGWLLWNLKRPLSAERQFAAAAKLAPDDPLARTAAAVGLFTKANPVKAFGQLGPLTGVFPKSAAVRFHLGLLLLWTGERQKAAAQLRLAIADGPQTVYASPARQLLSTLSK